MSRTEHLVVNQRISWDTHGDPNQQGNQRRGGYVTALPSTPDGHYSIRADAGEMQYIKRDRLIAHDCDREYKPLGLK